MKFEKIASDPQSSARCGVITTDHGQIETPIFMPVGTVGSVKGVYHRDLKEDIKAQIILGNTYHLYLRPGLDTLKAAGGLHKFISWDRPILTDSGGFQVFSLTGIRKLTPDGCTFSSHIDGSRHTFTPENNVDTQRIIGADIMMALDECCPGDADYNYAKKSLKMTQNWLERYLKRFDETEPLEFVRQIVKEGVSLLSNSAGNPYYIYPQVTRPFDTSSEGIPVPEEHQLQSIERLFSFTEKIQKAAGDVPVIGNGYTWLREFLANAGAANIEDGRCQMVGLGREAIAYPDAPNDVLKHGAMQRGRCCITCSKCTQMMRDHGMDGCVVRDSELYAPMFQRQHKEAKERVNG